MDQPTYHHPDLRSDLINKGLALIAAESIGALSLRRLAAECGVSHAAPYKHFKNKEELLSAINDHAEARFAAYLQAALDALPQADSQTRLIVLGKQYIQFMQENPYEFHFLFFTQPHSLIPTCHLNPEMLQTGCPSRQLFAQTAQAFLQDSGLPEASYPDQIIAMWAMVHGLATLLFDSNLTPSEDALQLAERILTQFVSGINRR